MSLLYKSKEECQITCEIKECYIRIDLTFYSDGGKFSTEELLAEYKLTPKRLLQILNDRDDYEEDEI